MGRWAYKIKVRDLLTDKGDHASVQATMTAIAERFSGHIAFVGFDFHRFRNIPEGDDFFGPADYANSMLDEFWDFCDSRRIWVEL